MRTSRWRLTFRVAAIAIAVAALIDPVWSSGQPVPLRLVVVDLAVHAADALERLKGTPGSWEIVTRKAAGPRLPCAPDEECVIVADGSRDVSLPADRTRPVNLLSLDPGSDPNVAILSAIATATHVSAAGTVRIELERSGPIASTEVRIMDEGAVVGAVSHKWQAATRATIEIPWWPLDAGPRRLRIEAPPGDGESTSVDNAIDIGVDVSSARIAVLVYDARPSWNSTFVRRALEDDARFTVYHRARVAPSVTIGTSNTGLDASILEATGLAIVGGLDALTSGEVDLLDRFVRVRGGTLVLLPDVRPSGAALRLFPGEWSEHLRQTAEPLGPLYASEVLRSTEQPLSITLARSGSEPAIVAAPVDHGRIVISGAMDAWRHREKDAGAFDRFWRSLVAEGATAGAPLSIAFDTQLVPRTGRTRFTVRDRRLSPAPRREARAIARCGEDRSASVIRLWPRATAGEFAGELSSATNGVCRVEIQAGDRIAQAGIAIAEQPQRGTQSTLAKLADAARASGGVALGTGDETAIARAIAARRQPASQIVSVRPMRAPWWIVPFAACLTAEWWLRRREGLR